MSSKLLTTQQLKALQLVAESDPGFKAQGKLGEFLDSWLVCEVLTKKLIMYHKDTKELPTTWQYTQLTAALNEFGYSYDKNRVKAAFKSNNKAKRGNKPARVLRNNFIHTLSGDDRDEIESRSEDLLNLLSYWKDIMLHAHNKSLQPQGDDLNCTS